MAWRIEPLATLAAMSPSLLAFDTATERLAIALLARGEQHLYEGEGGARASEQLLPRALALLRTAGLDARELDAIGFGRGPGAFTGLRTACAVAQGLAFGLGVPVLAIDSLALPAEDARAHDGIDELWVAMDARMDEAYAAHYRHDGERWQALAAPALYTLPALAERWRASPPLALAGNAAAAFGARLDARGARLIDVERSRAAALARLALAAWRDGPRLDAADALPLYLRDKVALTIDERAAARPAAGAVAR